MSPDRSSVDPLGDAPSSAAPKRTGLRLADLALMLVLSGAAASAGFRQPAHAQQPTAAATELARMQALSGGSPGSAPRPACGTGQPRPGLTIEDGKVTGADILAEMTGFAREADTTGGLGGELYVVTDGRDYDVRKGDKPIPGTLRYGVDQARARKVPMWVVFGAGQSGTMTIDVKWQIDLPDNLTIDASCKDIVLQATQHTMILYIRDSRNVILYGLTLRRTDFDLHNPRRSLTDILRSDGATDRIWVAHNDFSLCGHGCFDIVVTPGEKPWPAGALSRITVAFNRFRDSDRVMIYGFTDCEVQQVPNCTPEQVKEYREGSTRMFLTLQGNVFHGVAQRMPRASGRAFADVFNNVFAFEPLRHVDGRPYTASYAAVALSGATLLVEQNWFGQLTETSRPPLGAWTISTPAAMRMPHESDGRLRTTGNLTAANEVLGQTRPESVADPLYRSRETVLDFSKLGAVRAGACVLRRAGPGGTMAWDSELCQ